jgi:hypothetical protein
MDKTNPRRLRRRRILAIVAGFFLVLIIAATIDYWSYPYGQPVGGKAVNTGENGLWLRYTWYFGEHGPEKRRVLAKSLQDHEIRYAYFHVRHILHTGKLEYHYEKQARALVADLHRDAPQVKAVAWVYAGNPRGRGLVNLADPAVRKAMVGEAVWLVTKCGFDGVQWDYEICPDGDAGLLSLLRETRAALPGGKILSVATPIILPAIHLEWSEGYLAKVAAESDQVTLMCYDSAAYFPRAYVDMMHRQVVIATRAVARANPRCRVLIGIPTYGDGTASHNPRAENIALALRGVRAGLADPNANLSAFAGVAPFADYTTESDEWRVYEKLWQGR